MTRPSKYNEELQARFDTLVDRLYPMGMTKRDEKKAFDNYWHYGIVQQLAIHLGISMDTVYDWSGVDDKGEKGERFKEEFSETLKRWQLITMALLHRITPILGAEAPALAIFLRKTKLGELEISKHILEARLTTRNEKNLYVKITHELEEAETLGVDKADIDKVRVLLEMVRREQTQKVITTKGESIDGNGKDNGESK